jgi:hypothetical protein
MLYKIPPKGKNYKTTKGQFGGTTAKLPDTWRYGKRTKAQWIQAFEEEAKH